MTSHQAWKRALELWGSAVVGGNWRHPYTIQRRKNVVDRCEVGYHDDGTRPVIMGRGPTWESAFERAAAKEKP